MSSSAQTGALNTTALAKAATDKAFKPPPPEKC